MNTCTMCDDEPCLYKSLQKDTLFRTEAADVSVKNTSELLSLWASIFCSHASDILDEGHVCDMERVAERFPTFEKYMQTKIQQA